MKKNINILITSVGRRTLLLEYFKKELLDVGNLVAVDCSPFAPALYIADKHYIVPKINDHNYINVIKDICKSNQITAILSLIDPELSLLAKYASEFREIGVTAVVSPYSACEIWLDKYAASIFCENNNIKYPLTYNNLSDFENGWRNKKIDFPVFVKPRKGSASININKANNLECVKFIFKSFDDMIIQQYMNGQEIGVDVYVDMISKKVVSIFIKQKLAMRAGETDKAKSIKSESLFKIVEDLVVKANLIGPIDIDVFCVDGEYYISEINPRFGGGYPLAYECGVNFPQYIMNNLTGIVNEPQIGNYEENVYMMKHDRVTIITNSALNSHNMSL